MKNNRIHENESCEDFMVLLSTKIYFTDSWNIFNEVDGYFIIKDKNMIILAFKYGYFCNLPFIFMHLGNNSIIKMEVGETVKGIHGIRWNYKDTFCIINGVHTRFPWPFTTSLVQVPTKQ